MTSKAAYDKMYVHDSSSAILEVLPVAVHRKAAKESCIIFVFTIKEVDL